jgi:hypothetical protein
MTDKRSLCLKYQGGAQVHTVEPPMFINNAQFNAPQHPLATKTQNIRTFISNNRHPFIQGNLPSHRGSNSGLPKRILTAVRSIHLSGPTVLLTHETYIQGVLFCRIVFRYKSDAPPVKSNRPTTRRLRRVESLLYFQWHC